MDKNYINFQSPENHPNVDIWNATGKKIVVAVATDFIANETKEAIKQKGYLLFVPDGSGYNEVSGNDFL